MTPSNLTQHKAKHPNLPQVKQGDYSSQHPAFVSPPQAFHLPWHRHVASPLFLAVPRCISPRPGEIEPGWALYQPPPVLGQVHTLIWYHEPRWDPKTKGYSGTELAWIRARATAVPEVVFLGNLWGSCSLLLQNVRLGNNSTYGVWIHAVQPQGSTLKATDKQQHEQWMETIQVQVADPPEEVQLVLEPKGSVLAGAARG
ncbi:uncharacterized protein LOC132248652 isoform X2 [Alligator mississippiensis]|uniref:uncharacterized protein LOC132248652 isoform X2 n=1 Tax=Alligator mississippiensis TaxID=8496 RepID=UPI0028773D42|nr:uncharacterized protein LOC132248652 isoform X2 [Alligator mississippiensis]